MSLPCTTSCGPWGRASPTAQLVSRTTMFRISARHDFPSPLCLHLTSLKHQRTMGCKSPSLSRQIGAQPSAGRRVMYGDADTYVLMEPGEDEQFVTVEELQEKLKMWLEQWPGKEIPVDLAKFSSVEEAVQYLVTSVCELQLGDGRGSIQWFEVRLE